MELLDQMIAWENGDLNEQDTVDMFQALVNNGMAWRLQGVYGREATALIRAGYVQRPRNK